MHVIPRTRTANHSGIDGKRYSGNRSGMENRVGSSAMARVAVEVGKWDKVKFPLGDSAGRCARWGKGVASRP